MTQSLLAYLGFSPNTTFFPAFKKEKAGDSGMEKILSPLGLTVEVVPKNLDCKIKKPEDMGPVNA